jgi:hypothetical protein
VSVILDLAVLWVRLRSQSRRGICFAPFSFFFFPFFSLFLTEVRLVLARGGSFHFLSGGWNEYFLPGFHCGVFVLGAESGLVWGVLYSAEVPIHIVWLALKRNSGSGATLR